ncbi:hypothetical protein ASU87_21445 [Enterobacter roggenkampii]|nr:hypothetical protein ASU87_21445 [Enterobacter roggenkampii]
MMSLWDALRMNMMISYQELVRTFPNNLVTVNPKTGKKTGSERQLLRIYLEMHFIFKNFFMLTAL